MIITINNKNFTISDLENEYTLENAIFLQLKKHPLDVIFPEEFYSDKLIFFTDLLKTINENKQRSVKILIISDIENFDLNLLQTKPFLLYLKERKNEGIKHIYQFYIENILKEDNMEEFIPVLTQDFENSLKKLPLDFTIENLSYDFDYKNELDKFLQKLQVENLKKKQNLQNISQYYDNMVISEMVNEKVIHKISLKMEQVLNYIYIFNIVKFNTIENYEISLISLTIPEKQINQYKFNYLKKNNISQDFIKTYEEIKKNLSFIITNHKTNENMICVATIEDGESDSVYLEVKNIIDKDVVLKLIFQNIKYEIVDVSRLNIKGYFKITTNKYNKYMFSDYVTNILPNAYLDEREKIQTTAFSLNVIVKEEKEKIHLHFQEYITNQKYYLKIGIFNIKKTENYYKILIKKLYSNYLFHYDNIVKKYENMKVVVSKTNIISSSSLKPKQLIPELFISKYSRKCSKIPNVRMLEDEEKLLENNIKFIIFPKQDDNSLPNQYIFTCEQYEDYKYPGLTANTLPNKEQFPVIPCCFKTQQQNRNTPYGIYYQNLKKFDNSEHQLYKLQKPLINNAKGVISPFLKSLFGDEEYYRFGVYESKYNLLDCVYRSVNRKLEIKNEEEHFNMLRKIAENMKSKINICLQETYNENDLENKFDTKINKNFLKLMEYTYDINILIFSKTSIIMPQHHYLGEYSLLKKSTKFVLLYYHEKIDHLEILSSENQQLNNYVLNKIWEIYIYSLNPKYSLLTCLNNSIDAYLTLNDYTAFSQFCDLSGKCILLNYKHPKKTNFISIYYKIPIHPMPIKLEKKIKIYLCEDDDFISHFKFQKVDDITELQNDLIFLYLKSKKIIVEKYIFQNKTLYKKINSVEKNVNQMVSYQNFLKSYNKIRIIFEIILFYVIHNYNKEQYIDIYLNNLLVVDPENKILFDDFEFLPNFRNLLNFYKQKNNTFVVESDECKKRLIYNIKLFLKNSTIYNKILSKTLDNIPENYILDAKNSINSVVNIDIIKLKELFFCNNKPLLIFKDEFWCKTKNNFIINNININKGKTTFSEYFKKLNILMETFIYEEVYDKKHFNNFLKCYLYTSFKNDEFKLKEGFNIFFIETKIPIHIKHSILCYKNVNENIFFKLTLI